MIEGHTCFLDTEKISGTVETLKSIDTCLSNKDIKENFFEMEDLLNKYNFEHGNFTTTYKETLDMIEEELSKIKKEIYDLGFGVEKTTQVLSAEKQKTAKDVQTLSDVYNKPIGVGIPSESPISVLSMGKNTYSDIAEVIHSGVEPTPVVTSNNEINTVPIGIGIGVAGAVGAIGAITYDALRGKERIKIEDYKPQEESVEKESFLPPRELSDDIFDDPTPYYAIHNQETMNKFYGNDNNNRPQ